jgi:hypothetical protein
MSNRKTEALLPNEQLVVDVDLTESDLQRANFWFRLGKWSHRLVLIVLPLVGLLLFRRFGFSLDLFQNPPAGAVLIVLVLFPILYPIIIWFQTKRGFGNLQPFQMNIRYAFSSHGYKVSDEKSFAAIDWDTILRAAESKHSFHLFFHRSLFHTIPKRCFKQPEDIGRLRTLLKQVLGTKASVS